MGLLLSTTLGTLGTVWITEPSVPWPNKFFDDLIQIFHNYHSGNDVFPVLTPKRQQKVQIINDYEKCQAEQLANNQLHLFCYRLYINILLHCYTRLHYY